MNSHLDFVEAAAKENAAFHLENLDALLRESNTFMNLLVAGAGGSLALTVSLIEKKAAFWLQVGTGSVAVYLFGLAALLVWKCLQTREYFPPSNEPKHLLQENVDLDAIRKVELRNKQACIEANRGRNDAVGRWLNRCRALAAATPVVFVAAAASVGC